MILVMLAPVIEIAWFAAEQAFVGLKNVLPRVWLARNILDSIAIVALRVHLKILFSTPHMLCSWTTGYR